MTKPPIDDSFFDGNDTEADFAEPLNMVAFSDSTRPVRLVSEYIRIDRGEKRDGRDQTTPPVPDDD